MTLCMPLLPRIANELSSLQHVYNPAAKQTILAATKNAPKPESGSKVEIGEKAVIPKSRLLKKTVEPIAQNLVKKKDVQCVKTKGPKSEANMSSIAKEELDHDSIQIREKLKAQIKQSEMIDKKVAETKTKNTSAANLSVHETSGEKNEGDGNMAKKTKAEKVAEKKAAREKAAAETMKAEIAASKRDGEAEKKAKEKAAAEKDA